MIKKFFAFLLIILLLPVSPVFAKASADNVPNWVKVVSDNGETVDLNLNSIVIALDTVEYEIKTEKDDDGFFFVRRFSTELYNPEMPTAILSSVKYKDEISEENLIERDVYTDLDYKPAVDGTLSAEVFSVLSKRLNASAFAAGERTMKKYLNRQYKNVKKQWKTRHYKDYSRNEARHLPTGSQANVYFEDAISLKLNREGEVISRKSEDPNSLHVEISEFPPLPEGYSGETYNLNLKLRCYKYYGAEKYTADKVKVIKENPNTGSLIMAKNHFPPVVGPMLLGVVKFSNALMKPIDFFSDHPLLFLPGAVYTAFASVVSRVFIKIPFGWLGEDVGY